MDSIENRIAILKKAKFPRKKLLLKIEAEFGVQERAKIEEILEKEEITQNRKQKKTIIEVLIVIFFAILFLFTIFYFMYFQYSSFFSSKCNIGPIAISGDPQYRQRTFDILSLIEENNCEYLSFIWVHTPYLDSKELGFRYGGLYSGGDSANISPFTGDKYYAASIVFHEACHAFQTQNNQPISEGDCQYTQYIFLKSINAPAQDIEYTKTLGTKWPEYTFNETNTNVFLEWKNK